MLLIQPSPCTYQLRRLSAGTCACRAGGEPNEILQPPASALLSDRSPREDDVGLHPGRGRPGARAPHGVALARPRQKWHCDESGDLATLAAAYAVGLIKNHQYRDGNKRIGFLAIVTFLEMHGKTFTGADAEVVVEILTIAPPGKYLRNR